MWLTVVVGILVLSVLVIVHELGHFMAAKACGVYVEEFGLGLSPRIYGKKLGDTIYSINWIPFGGFNKIAGEVDPNVPGGLASRGYGPRLLVIGGGILMNLLLPFVLLTVAYAVPHDIVSGDVTVLEVNEGSPAEAAGITAGDVLLSIDGKPLRSSSELGRYVQVNLGDSINLVTQHPDGATEEVSLVPRWNPPEGHGAVGILYRTENPVIVSESYRGWQAIVVGFNACIETMVLYKNGIIGLITGTVPLVMTGPVGIVQITGEMAQAGISPVLEMAAFISIALAVTQLLPFPALDGGRLVFVVLEMLRRGKKVSHKVENAVHSLGFIILLALMVAITYQDILRIVMGESLIP